MKEFARSSVGQYVAAALLTVVATAVALALSSLIEPSGPEILLAAVTLTAWYGGLGPGLVATGLSVLAIDQFLMPPEFRSVLGWDDVVRLLVFILVSVLISWLNGARKRAKETLQQSYDELEARVEQRTADLARANEVLEDQISERLRAEQALRESEEIHRITLSNISDSIFVTDDAGAFTYICPGVAAIFGRSQEEVGRIGNIAGLLGDHLYDRDELGLVGEISNIEREIIDAAGLKRLLLINVKRVSIKGGHVLYTCREITERRQLDENHIQLEREQAANRAKDECLAMISHDLRTPLNSVLGWVQLIRRTGADESMLPRALDAIEQGARSQQQLLADLLDVSRVKAGGIKLDLHPIDLVNLVDSAIDMVRLDAINRSIEIRFSGGKSISEIPADAERLKRVVWNLLVNAIKFTQPGGTVEVRIEETETAARIVVADTGCGIAQESIPFIFDRFYQASGATVGGGLGLGLSIARRFVEMHGGTISAHSDGLGRGATFTIDLPLTPIETVTELAAQEWSGLPG
jgi:PAS domain S-box-containing protein